MLYIPIACLGESCELLELPQLESIWIWDTHGEIRKEIHHQIPSEMVIQVNVVGCQQHLDPMTSEPAKKWDGLNEVDFTGRLILPVKYLFICKFW